VYLAAVTENSSVPIEKRDLLLQESQVTSWFSNTVYNIFA
jgi:hypothetical protein